ncbi:site-2 protease family protein [Actinoplanes teichomyceticus]|uniref:Zinc metalloprotease n=1 Tax=Actinoplanes teichomyceticus TaxID=1867 RepID=A0A561W9L3_ACTTI|nr:site-2 protease family protein [Actinoplanes teichomyceticus]TWG20561.1 Zn-dependent protease [Actinoplanes teichomyceticus]GIF15896.1 peptidase M50 [Actinoplanes teichomyceticus]
MEDSARQRPPAPRGGRAVGRVLGIPVHANASMVLLALLVTVVYGNYARAELGLGQPWAYLVGVGFVVCLLGSVLLHELGHALVARRHGIGVRRITLELLSGWTEMERDAPSPRVDALVSLAGPGVSLLLGGVATGAALVLPEDTVPGQIAFQLAVSNVLVAVFNVLPGLPLDGGRALRAGMWALLKDRNRATVVAGWAGRVIAFGTAVVVLLLFQLGVLTLFGMAFVLLVTLTLWHGAGQSIRLGRMTGRFPLIDLGSLARPVLAVPAGTPLGEAQRRRAEDPRPDVVLAVSDAAGSLTALVDPVAAERVPVDRRPWVSVESVARSREALTSLPVSMTGEQVVRALQAHPGAQYLVTAGEDVIGVLRVADVAAVLEPRRTQRT